MGKNAAKAIQTLLALLLLSSCATTSNEDRVKYAAKAVGKEDPEDFIKSLAVLAGLRHDGSQWRFYITPATGIFTSDKTWTRNYRDNFNYWDHPDRRASWHSSPATH